MKSIFYRCPSLYDVGIQFIFLDGLKILKDIVGKGKSVFEPACGYGRLKKYLYPDCSYSGVDLNETFIEYGKKRNRDINVGDALDERWYREADTILLCDIIHHLNGQKHDLVSRAIKFAREKVVIVEPLFVDVFTKSNALSRAIGKFMAAMDADGVNEIDRWLSKDEYMGFFQSIQESHHIKKMKMRNFRNHIFVEMYV